MGSPGGFVVIVVSGTTVRYTFLVIVGASGDDILTCAP